MIFDIVRCITRWGTQRILFAIMRVRITD
jgi:hypothetical protein